MDWSPPDFSVLGIFAARILEWIVLPSSRGSSWPRDWICISFGSCMVGGFFTAESQGKSSHPVVQLPICFWLCNPTDCSTPGLPVRHYLLELAQVHVHWVSDAIQPSHPLMPFSPSAINPSQRQRLFQWVIWFPSDYQNTGASPSVLPKIIRVDFSSDWRVWSPRCPRDSQDSSPAPQFEGINCLAFCLLYYPALTTICDHWEDRSLDYTDLHRQSNVSAFRYTVEVCHSFPAKKQSSSDFMAAVIICSDSRAQERSLSLPPHFPFYFPCSNGAGCHDLSCFLILCLKPALSLSSFTFVKRLFSSASLSPIRMVSSAYLRLLMFLPPFLIPACNSSSLAFLMMCSACRLNKQGDSRQHFLSQVTQ